MSDVAITASGLGKCFDVGRPAERYGLLGHSLARAVGSPLRTLRARRAARDAEPFWALRDVDFEVRRGEVVGLIGHNGAGKSTLLKVLARITEPTCGAVDMRGRVGSLLEVGTGFHQELSGRENVFLSGAILGMRREEIRRKFDEIVAFAEVERFLDTAVKHYSSGMHLRLAFSVAAHLQPEILLVDEVLAVGDMRFQRKCLGKMEDVAGEGRTVLFVSHNLSAVKELCRTAIVLQGGRVTFRGGVVEGVAHYAAGVLAAGEADGAGAGWSAVGPADLAPERDDVADHSADDWRATPGAPVALRSTLDVPATLVDGRLFCVVHDSAGTMAVHHRVELADVAPLPLAPGRYDVRATFPPLWLAPGLYTMHLKLLARAHDGADVRYTSERRLLDVHGWNGEHGGAYLAPSCAWTVEATAGVAAPAPAVAGAA